MSEAISVRATLGGQDVEVNIPYGTYSLLGLVQAAQKAAQVPGVNEGLYLTDGQRILNSDADARSLQPGAQLVLLHNEGKGGNMFKERVTFNPHPKTLTMAGDYEYFAAQGHHPLAFALAELIDNSLRATKSNHQPSETRSSRPRSITVSILLGGSKQGGLICVRDNGSGMSVQELNNWAVMNLAMEDKGLVPSSSGKAGERYLSSDISYFGVGSKNAAFYLGGSVKVVTRSDSSDYVHELCIRGAELERRYRDGAAVYEEDMVHREPGSLASRTDWEAGFASTQEWVEEEVGCDSRSFTRVIIGDLKPEVLEQLQDEAGAQALLRDLAHLYHYYLHGAAGNSFTTRHADFLPNGEAVPSVQVELVEAEDLLWRTDLRNVEDDLESKYLRAARHKLEFGLEVPNMGVVEGVLWYFPFEDDQETIPVDPYTLNRMMMSSSKASPDKQDAVGTQPPGAAARAGAAAGGATQRPALMSQFCASRMFATQAHAAGGAGGAAGSAAGGLVMLDQGTANAFLASSPIFEAYWQGRLIPGTCVDTLPFVEAVRKNRKASERDKLPDEVFGRIRGALFFGPGFRVTRNKLMFRDNMTSLLASAQHTERNMTKKFREWLAECHKLDRSIRYECLCNHEEQAAARRSAKTEDITLFQRMTDGVQALNAGDVVKISTKNTKLAGRILFFTVPQAVTCEGCYSSGSVTVTLLPEKVFGQGNRHTFFLRRTEGLIEAEELQEMVTHELNKLPAALCLEPMKLAASGPVQMTAGDVIPETSIAVLNSNRAKIRKIYHEGSNTNLAVVQTLYYVGEDNPYVADGGTSDTSAAAAAEALTMLNQIAGKKRQKTGRRDRKQTKKAATKAAKEVLAAEGNAGKENEPVEGGEGAAAGAAAADADGEKALAGVSESGLHNAAESRSSQQRMVQIPEHAEKVLDIENKTPIHDVFQFQRITGGLMRAGYYCLEYKLVPEAAALHARGESLVVVLQVAPATAASFSISGAGRALAQCRPILLGEALPPLHLAFSDAHGNPCRHTTSAGSVRVELLKSSLAAGGALVEEVKAAADLVQTEDGQMAINRLHMLPPSPTSKGLALFSRSSSRSSKQDAAADSAKKSLRSGSALPASQQGLGGQDAGGSGLGVVPTVELFVAVYVKDLPPQDFPVRLRPGAPHSIQLLAGHPFTSAPVPEGALCTQLMSEHQQRQQLVAASVISREPLPTFKVQVLDSWGNPTSESEDLPFAVAVECIATEPASPTFPIDCRGVAVISGLIASRPQTEETTNPDGAVPAAPEDDSSGPYTAPFKLWPTCMAEDTVQEGSAAEGVAAALAVAAPAKPLELLLSVQPSSMPATLTMMYQGEALPSREDVDSKGEVTTVWLLHGVEAGSKVTGLTLCCLDEVGRPAETRIKGKLQASWAKGNKKVELGPKDITLPPIPIQESTAEVRSLWLRFNGDAQQWPDLCLEVNLEVTAAAGEPASWSVSLVDYQPKGAAGIAAAAGAGERDLSAIQCGEPFYLEIEALDACNNRCRLSPDRRLVPQVHPTHCDPEAGPLVLDPTSWNCQWDETQQGGDVCQFKLWMAGPVGMVKLSIRDGAGEDGTSLLAADELDVELVAGPPSTLVLTGPAPVMEIGSRELIKQLTVGVLDEWGNPVESANFEVGLNGCALAVEESAPAAKAAAAGNNRVKLRGGTAVLKNIRLQAELEGSYVLRIASVSRKVAVHEGTLVVKVAHQNLVTGLQLAPPSLPEGQEDTVGCTATITMDYITEDGKPLPWEVTSSSIAVLLGLPNPDGQEGAAGSSRKGAGGNASLVVLAPDREASQAAESSSGGGDGAASSCKVCFITPELTAAGTYTLTAEYSETRPEMVAALSKQELVIRSSSCTMSLEAAAPTSVSLEGPSASVREISVSNGPEDSGRCMLRQAAVQLRDQYNNPCHLAGVKLRWRFQAASGEGGEDACEQLPEVCNRSSSQLTAATDDRGRAFFGDIGILPETGKLAAGHSVMNCMLSLDAKLPKPSRSSGGGGWITCWSCPVQFSDDISSMKMLQVLKEQRNQLEILLREHKGALNGVSRRVEDAAKQRQAAALAFEQRLATCNKLLGPEMLPQEWLPKSPSQLKLLVQLLEERATRAPEREVMAARMGNPKTPVAMAIQRCLTLGDTEVVGAFAQLAYVEDPQLSALIAATFPSCLQTLVVKTFEATKRLRQHLTSLNMTVPSMLPSELIQSFNPEAEGRNAASVRMRNVTERAQQLMADACEETDPPLPMLLPHTRILRSNPAPSNCQLQAEEWPPGCLGFAINLVRPAMKGIRGTILYSQIGRTIVFETLDSAAAYRQFVAQVLRSSLPTVVSLDGGKLSSTGVVAGSGFKVVPVSQAPQCFGMAPDAPQRSGAGLDEQRLAALTAAIEALEGEEAAAAELAAAEAAAQALQQGNTGQQAEEVQQQLNEVQQEIAKQQQLVARKGRTKDGKRRAVEPAAEARVPEEGGGIPGSQEEAEAEEEPAQEQQAGKRSKRRKR